MTKEQIMAVHQSMNPFQRGFMQSSPMNMLPQANAGAMPEPRVDAVRRSRIRPVMSFGNGDKDKTTTEKNKRNVVQVYPGHERWGEYQKWKKDYDAFQQEQSAIEYLKGKEGVRYLPNSDRGFSTGGRGQARFLVSGDYDYGNDPNLPRSITSKFESTDFSGTNNTNNISFPVMSEPKSDIQWELIQDPQKKREQERLESFQEGLKKDKIIGFKKVYNSQNDAGKPTYDFDPVFEGEETAPGQLIRPTFEMYDNWKERQQKKTGKK